MKNNDEILYKKMNEYEEYYKNKGYSTICGIDEVGRGPLAGPVVIAGVILNTKILGLKDSKKLSKTKIEKLNNDIINNDNKVCIKEISANDIDKYGIRNVVLKAMNEISNELEAKFYLVDYEKIEKENSLSITKGDENSNSIAAASIVAKYYRDNIMKEYAKKHPLYGFDTNAGYGTKQHLNAIKEHGYIKNVHRKTFNPIKTMIKENDENN